MTNGPVRQCRYSCFGNRPEQKYGRSLANWLGKRSKKCMPNALASALQWSCGSVARHYIPLEGKIRSILPRPAVSVRLHTDTTCSRVAFASKDWLCFDYISCSCQQRMPPLPLVQQALLSSHLVGFGRGLLLSHHKLCADRSQQKHFLRV